MVPRPPPLWESYRKVRDGGREVIASRKLPDNSDEQRGEREVAPARGIITNPLSRWPEPQINSYRCYTSGGAWGSPPTSSASLDFFALAGRDPVSVTRDHSLPGYASSRVALLPAIRPWERSGTRLLALVDGTPADTVYHPYPGRLRVSLPSHSRPPQLLLSIVSDFP